MLHHTGFPESSIFDLFRSQKGNLEIGRGGDELNGLVGNPEPENCSIILSSKSEIEPEGEYRIFYLVKHHPTGQLFFFRVCSAMKGFGYDSFVVFHRWSEGNEPQDFTEIHYLALSVAGVHKS